ncbi:MAG: cytochrome c oxidase subunit II [Oligoflexia bacterium]|nr:cytochrome c oxidase subunit II [Oligoflexia bacterium]
MARLEKLEEFLIVISFIACFFITLAFIYFAFRFRRKEREEEGGAVQHHNLPLEIVWSFIPFVIFMVAFAWGWFVYKEARTPPADSLEIQVYGQKWNWEFVYKNGRKTTNEFYVPLNRPVKLIMTSRDVIHSFYIPTFKIKQDVVPGLYTFLWFEANHKGSFHVFCTEFCGSGHASMGARLNVLPLADWENWLKIDPYKGLSLVEIGQKAFQGRCTVCHKPSQENLIGPGLAALYNTERSLENGSVVLADENYLRESILNPSAKIVKGYPNQMTPFAGLLSEEELSGLIEYIKSLK